MERSERASGCWWRFADAGPAGILPGRGGRRDILAILMAELLP